MFQQFAKRGLFLLSIILLISSTNIFSQEFTQIQGMVYDDNTGLGLTGANIRLEEMNRGISSADSGKFVFVDIPNGRYTISVSYIGYKLKKISVLVRDTEEMFIPINLVPQILMGQTVEVTGTRAIEGETPVAFTNISNKELNETYTASDVPMLLNEVPGVYAYSLAGDNLGYSFLKIRGFDQRRIGVMINDIPLNDPEDHEVYWVDLPDLTESVQDIQIQRGVGSSVYGTSTFGGSESPLPQEACSSARTAIGIAFFMPPTPQRQAGWSARDRSSPCESGHLDQYRRGCKGHRSHSDGPIPVWSRPPGRTWRRCR